MIRTIRALALAGFAVSAWGQQLHIISQTGGSSVVVPNGGSVTIAATGVGSAATANLSLLNAGGTAVTISQIELAGSPDMTLASAPATPSTLAAGGLVSVAVQYTPASVAAASATLSITTLEAGAPVSYTVNFSGTVPGQAAFPNFVAGYADPVNDNAVPVLNGSVIAFPAAGDIAVTIENRGTGAGSIRQIAISGDAAFQVQHLPLFPVTIAAGGSMQFTIHFAPPARQAYTATLTIAFPDRTWTVEVRGSGAGAALPQYRFEGVSGTQAPLQQPGVGLSLTAAYTAPIKGTLALDFISDVFSANPAVQFSTGGRVVGFTIPAGETAAVFDNGQTQVRLQTGTVAGTITVAAAFTSPAGVSLAPEGEEKLSLPVAQAAPQLLGGDLSARTLSSFTITFTGFTTTRSLSRLDLQLNAKSGVRLDNGHLGADLRLPAANWFQNANSTASGGLYSISVPINLQGGRSNEDQTAHIQSVDITISNELGESNKLTVALP
ncbi:MAG: choice-of-anchor D domain-containing protein [Acidobacteriota bacterium]